MEVKISGAVPLWFTKIISGLNVYPVSFSKYGTEYKQYVLTNYTSLMYKGEIYV
ncbi:MAG: VTC domain-containing protein [Lachnospira eligens]